MLFDPIIHLNREINPRHTLLKVIRTKSLFEYICEKKKQKIIRKKKYLKKRNKKK